MFTTAAAGTAAAAAAASSAVTAGVTATTAGAAAAGAAAAASSAVAAGAGAIGSAAAGTGLFTLSNVMMGASALSALGGVYGSIQSAKQQKEQARYQSAVAQQNADLAEENASAQRRQGYEAMVEQRRKAAKLIGTQRAVAGASGVAVDVGSNLDIQTDTASQGEMDALKLYQQGLDKAYSYDVQATNYSSQSKAYEYSARRAGSTGTMNAVTSAIGGIADMGSTWMKYSAMNSNRSTIHSGSMNIAGAKSAAKRLAGAR